MPRTKESYIKNKEKILAWARKYREENKEKISERRKADYRKNRELYRAKYREMREKNIDRERESSRKYYDANRDRARELSRWYHYGITPEEYNEFLKIQGGVCAICRSSDWNGQTPHVDHDHATMKIRGIICHRCNSTMGRVNDSIELLGAMLKYLTEGGVVSGPVVYSQRKYGTRHIKDVPMDKTGPKPKT